MFTGLGLLRGALCLAVCAFGDESRIMADSGILAVRQNAEAPWTMLRAENPSPESGEFRAGPTKAVTLAIDGGLLHIAPETIGSWNRDRRELSIRQGQIYLQLKESAEPWLLSRTGNENGWRVPGGASVIWLHGDSDAWHVIAGRITADGNDARELSAPISLIERPDGTSATAAPKDETDAWSKKLLRWTQAAQGLGQLIAKDAQDGSPVRLEIARYRVNVVLQPPVALVQIDESFYNPYLTQQEGTFVFNLPPGASVSRFAMFVTPGELIEGELIGRKRADEIYTSIVRRRRDPAILEQIGDNLFRMRVFPIFAQDTKRILLDYTVPLVAERGHYRFELPLISDLKPIWDFSVKGTIYPPIAADKIESATHPQLKFETGDDGRVYFAVTEQLVKPPPMLHLSYPAPAERPATVRAFTRQEDDQQFFVATIPAGDNRPREAPTGPADVLVVVDTSGSAGNLARARLAARTVINHLRPIDRVQIGCVDMNYRPLTQDWLSPGHKEVRQAYQKLQEQFALGGSALEEGLDQAASVLRKSPLDRRRILIYIGDGVDSSGIPPRFWRKPEYVADDSPPVICMVHLNPKQTETTEMKRAVRDTGGRYFYVDSTANGWDELFEWSLAGFPLQTNRVTVEADGVPASDLFAPADWPAGRDLHIFGSRPASEKLILKLAAGDQPEKTYELAVPPGKTDDAVFTGRLWAQEKLAAKLGEYTRAGGLQRDLLVNQITAISQEWSLMSPFTAFLVLESEADYTRWKIDRRVRHRYWSPPEALAPVPLPDWVKPKKPSPGSPSNGQLVLRGSNGNRQGAQELDWQRSQVANAVEDARNALKDGNVLIAHAALARVREFALEFQPEEYQRLHRIVSDKMERETALAHLGLWRSAADRQATRLWSAPPPLFPILVHGGLDPDYLERTPHVQKFVKPLFLTGDLPLREFAEQLQQALGVPVMVAEKEISDDGGSSDVTITTEGLQGISVENFVRLALEPHDLQLVPGKHIFHITTMAKASEKMATKIYPVGDLLRTDILPPPERLSNPLLDRDEMARRRIEARLQQPISVNFADAPLADALALIGHDIGQPFRINDREIAEDGGSTQGRVTLKLANLPADVILREILEPHDLVYYVGQETLMVTTTAKADEKMETRVYSGAGLVDGMSPEPLRRPNPNPYRMMGGGFFGGGGWGMGGMGGGMMGGMGVGGMGMGGGMMGGGGFGVGGAAPLGGSPDESNDSGIVLSEIAPPDVEIAAEEEEIATEQEEFTTSQPAPFTQTWPMSMAGERGTVGFGSGMLMIRQNTSGEWEDEEGLGGSISWFPNAVSLVVRQTHKVHREIAKMYSELRKLADRDPASRLHRPRVRKIGAADAKDFGPLMMILRRSTFGEWEDEEGLGGALVPNNAAMALTIRQTEEVHGEIERLLALLRRARYVAESLPNRDTLEGIDDSLFFFDQVSLTDLPRTDVLPVIPEQERRAALELLAIRGEPDSLSQHWRRASGSSPATELTVKRLGSRMALILPDRSFRADGIQAAVAYPNLALAEIDAWGESVRKLTDGALPWMPHRDNAELVQNFEVAAAGETPHSITLRLTFRLARDLTIEAGFDRASKQPVAWKVLNHGHLIYELKFGDRQVTAVDPNGNEIERWELLGDDAPSQLAALDDFGENWLVVKVSDPSDPFTLMRNALRDSDYPKATDALRKLLARQPKQPLVNFLFAWCSELAKRLNAQDVEEQRTALRHVLASQATELIHLLNPTFFPSLGAHGLLTLLQEVPEEERSLAVWDQMVELAQAARNYPVALAAVSQVMQLDPDGPQSLARRVQQIEFLLQTHDVAAAKKAAEAAAAMTGSVTILCEIGDWFERFDQPQIAERIYSTALDRDSLSADERSEILARQALWLAGEPRWRKLFEAAEILPARSPNRRLYVDTIIAEMHNAEHVGLLLEFAEKSKRRIIRRDLRMWAAELSDDPQQAAEIALDLYRRGQLPANRDYWFLVKISQGAWDEQLIEILEGRLRSGGLLTKQDLSLLSIAYRRFGRIPDAQRAETQERDVKVPVRSEEPSLRGWRSSAGVGFF